MSNLLVALATLGAAASQVVAQATAAPTTLTNSVGMTFVLIQPGAMQVGKFTSACPVPPAPGAAPAVPAPPPGVPAPTPAPRDPRNEWTAADYEACATMAARDSSPGFRTESQSRSISASSR